MATTANAENGSNNNQKQWYQHTGLWVLVVIVVFVLMIFTWYTKGYNNLAYSQQNVSQQEGQVQNVLQRRGDLIPEMVGAVKGSQKHESNVYGTIAKARTQYYNASSSYSHTKDPSARARALNQQNGAFNAMVGGIKEAYPNLQSNGQMSRLMAEIEGSNNRVSVERHNLNTDIQTYNDYVTGFPNNMIANMSNHQTIPYFKGDSKAQSAPKVNF